MSAPKFFFKILKPFSLIFFLLILPQSIFAEEIGSVVVLNHYSFSNNVSFEEFVINNVLTFCLIVSGIIIVIIAAFVFYILGVKSARKETQRQIDIAEALSRDFPFAMILDVETDNYIIVKKFGVVLRQKDRTIQKANGTIWNDFMEKNVTDKNKESLKNELTFKNIQSGLAINKDFTCSFSMINEGKEHMFQAYFSTIYSHVMKKEAIIVGFREIDSIVEEEQKQKALLKDALAAAENSNRAKTSFLNSMSHDIRTPMNAIIGFTELGLSHINDRPMVKNCLEKISLSSRHLLNLINDVLEVSRIESGKITINDEPVFLTEVINEVRDIVMPNILEKNLEIEIDTSKIYNDYVLTDRVKLNQVLLNIVGNSIKFTNSGGLISITVSENRQLYNDYAKYEFRIKDNGIGMSKEFQEHIFEAFAREKSSTVSKIPGTGLGLTITKSIIDMVGGTISVKSLEGVGTEFIIHLQFKICGEVVKPKKQKRAKNFYTAQRKKAKGLKVLVVEDNELNQEIAATILQEAGYKVDLAEDGTVAVEKMTACEENRYDFILMDIQMPEMDGYEATRVIRKMPGVKGSIPIIAMTANAFEEDKQNSIAAGMNAHITKPLDIEVLFNTISSVLKLK